MGKLCFESVTNLIGQLILLAKYGGPEVRDVKCSQRRRSTALNNLLAW